MQMALTCSHKILKVHSNEAPGPQCSSGRALCGVGIVTTTPHPPTHPTHPHTHRHTRPLRLRQRDGFLLIRHSLFFLSVVVRKKIVVSLSRPCCSKKKKKGINWENLLLLPSPSVDVSAVDLDDMHSSTEQKQGKTGLWKLISWNSNWHAFRLYKYNIYL